MDDKIINKAIEEGVDPSEISERYIEEYFKDADALTRNLIHLKSAKTWMPSLHLFRNWWIKDLAYNIDGNVYYRVNRFEDYGKLSKQSIDDLEQGARISTINEEKEDPLDFAGKNPSQSWESPWEKVDQVGTSSVQP